jgi:hypothetical protein
MWVSAVGTIILRSSPRGWIAERLTELPRTMLSGLPRVFAFSQVHLVIRLREASERLVVGFSSNITDEFSAQMRSEYQVLAYLGGSHEEAEGDYVPHAGWHHAGARRTRRGPG